MTPGRHYKVIRVNSRAASSKSRNLKMTVVSLVTALAGLAGASETASAIPASHGETRVDLSTLPSLRQAKKFFPAVSKQDRQGYSTSSVVFPSCADETGSDPGAMPEHVWVAGFYNPKGGKRMASPEATLYPFPTQSDAALVMSRIKEHVAGCDGLHTGSEEYSRYTTVAAPVIGEDRVAFIWSHAYEFESGVSRAHEIWAQMGSMIAVVSVTRTRGHLPLEATDAFAKFVVKRAS